VAIATLAVLGESADALAARHGLALETLLRVPHRIQEPGECAACARGEALDASDR
jgi:hypothetical protein